MASHVANLSLAGPGSGSVGLGTSGLAIGLAAGVRSHVDRVGERSLAHASQRLASSSLAVLLISGEVEGDEEDQV